MRLTLAETGADASGENGLNGPLRFAQPPLQTLFSPLLTQETSWEAINAEILRQQTLDLALVFSGRMNNQNLGFRNPI